MIGKTCNACKWFEPFADGYAVDWSDEDGQYLVGRCMVNSEKPEVVESIDVCEKFEPKEEEA